MTLRSLEIFVSVVKHGKMSHAAKELYISQPTISQAISEIEAQYHIQLFDRLYKKLYITDAGRQLYNYAQKILSLSNEMEKSMTYLSSHKIIKVGATITVGKCVLVDIVKAFEEKYPSVKVQVFIDNTEIIEDMLLNGNIDVALVEGCIKSVDLVVKPAIPDCLVLVCNQSHLFAQRSSISLEELEGEPFILREVGSGTRATFEKYLSEKDIHVFQKWTCHCSDAILEAVMAGQGLTVISKRLAEAFIKTGKLYLVPIDDIEINRSFSLVYHKTKFISETLSNFIADIK